MAVITISRQSGSGGDEIASRVCEALSYHLFDKRLIDQAARDVGLSEQEVIDYSEENHQMRGFLDRLFGRSQMVGQARARSEVRLSEAGALALAQKAVRSAYKAGDMIIIGRGGQQILKYYPGVLHVRIEAPLEQRVQRAREQLPVARKGTPSDSELRRGAESWVQSRDASSADYIKRFYNVDWSDSQLYHLIINTGKFSLDQAAGIIVGLVKEMEPQRV